MKNCKCGGEAIVEDGFISELNSTGKFVCCLECERQTKVHLEHEETKALNDWENDKLDVQAMQREAKGIANLSH